MRTLLLIYIATLVNCEYKGDFVKHVRHGGRTLIRHGRSRVHFSRMHSRARDLVAQVIEAERSSELGESLEVIIKLVIVILQVLCLPFYMIFQNEKA